ncbi:MAG: sigma-70 family RNA polymerase sigma factor [Cytophagaceae bacterium]|nr:sigma-70 family RNA polymerase sigma factor [Cytophagaceae bacterium]
MIIFYKKAKQNKLEEKINVTSFICTVAKNLWLNRIKRMSRSAELPEEEAYESDENLLANIITEEKRTAISRLLSEIGEECKKLLTYSIYDNLSMKEICRLMNYSSEDVAKTYNYRCKQKLIQLVMKNKAVISLLKNES